MIKATTIILSILCAGFMACSTGKNATGSGNANADVNTVNTNTTATQTNTSGKAIVRKADTGNQNTNTLKKDEPRYDR